MVKVGKQSGRIFIEVGSEFMTFDPTEARAVLAGLMGVVPNAECVAPPDVEGLSLRDVNNAVMCAELCRRNGQWLGFKVDGTRVVGYRRQAGGGYLMRRFEGDTVEASFALAIESVRS